MFGRTVIDKTGLTGLYDFTLTYTSDADAALPASAASDPVSGPTIFTALEEQLGLRLEPAKGPVPILVIESDLPPLRKLMQSHQTAVILSEGASRRAEGPR